MLCVKQNTECSYRITCQLASALSSLQFIIRLRHLPFADKSTYYNGACGSGRPHLSTVTVFPFPYTSYDDVTEGIAIHLKRHHTRPPQPSPAPTTPSFQHIRYDSRHSRRRPNHLCSISHRTHQHHHIIEATTIYYTNVCMMFYYMLRNAAGGKFAHAHPLCDPSPTPPWLNAGASLTYLHLTARSVAVYLRSMRQAVVYIHTTLQQ